MITNGSAVFFFLLRHRDDSHVDLAVAGVGNTVDDLPSILFTEASSTSSSVSASVVPCECCRKPPEYAHKVC